MGNRDLEWTKMVVVIVVMVVVAKKIEALSSSSE